MGGMCRSEPQWRSEQQQGEGQQPAAQAVLITAAGQARQRGDIHRACHACLQP